MSRPLPTRPLISVVIPVFNEEGSVRRLHRELVDVAAQHNLTLEIIMVDDGSEDSSWELICQLAREDERVHGIRFRRNFGKAASLRAGFERARGDTIVMMDADLQDRPDELPAMLRRLDEGLDLVSGWKRQRHDPWHKRYPSKGFNTLVNWLSGMSLHDHNCGYKCFRRQVIEEVDLYGERHRFIPVLAHARGFRVGELPVRHRARTAGKSKYGWSRIPKGLLDVLSVVLVTRFQSRPQHFLGTAGLGSVLTGGIVLAAASILAWFTGNAESRLTESALFYVALLLLMAGVQFLTVGLVAELLVAGRSAERVTCSIVETTETQTGTRLRRVG
jgi:glycosyltransferase involved in cell wall biosynthesis